MTKEEETIAYEVQHFAEIAKRLVDVRSRKAADYGNSWKIFGLIGIIYQIGSKFVRIWNLKDKSHAMNEPLKDSFRDIAVYGIMAIQLIEMGQTGDMFTGFGQNLADIAKTDIDDIQHRETGNLEGVDKNNW